ncbi:hypothetical protein D3C71_1760540 [compost metagenome]
MAATSAACCASNDCPRMPCSLIYASTPASVRRSRPMRSIAVSLSEVANSSIKSVSTFALFRSLILMAGIAILQAKKKRLHGRLLDVVICGQLMTDSFGGIGSSSAS